MLDKLNKYLLFSLPAVVFLTNFPLISLGDTESMHLEISLPEIWLVIFFFVNLRNLKKLIDFFSPKRLALISLFPLYASLSIIWSPNHLRAILTSGLAWLILFAILNIIYLLKQTGKSKRVIKENLLKMFLLASFIVGLFCWLQTILDLIGVSREASLMCAGCTYRAFGFPHPNGFAIEPQFMGGLLIAPAILTFYLGITDKKKRCFVANFIFTATLFLTFSRGAIYAFLIAATLFAIIFAKKAKTKKPLLIFPSIIAAFLFTLTMQGLMAAVSPTSDTFISGVTKVIHHLTLGHIDLRPSEDNLMAEGENVVIDAKTKPTPSTYSGYVSESTEIRVNLTDLAIKAAKKSPLTLFFGAGLGSAGTVLNREFPEEIGSPKQIVQNEYASLLLELGLVGIILAALAVIIGLKHITNIYTLAIIIGYALTLLFFSGFPNAFHIYLLPPFLESLRKDKNFTKPLISWPRRK